MPDGGTLHIEDIQDQVELALMRAGEQKVARAMCSIAKSMPGPEPNPARHHQASPHAERHRARWQYPPAGPRPGRDPGVRRLREPAHVEPGKIVEDSLKNLYDGVTVDGVSQALMMTARTLVEKDPNYTYVTARLLQDNLRREALSFLGIADEATYQEMADYYKPAFQATSPAASNSNSSIRDWRNSTSNASATPSIIPAMPSSPTWVCRPSTTATSSTATRYATSCPR